MTLANLGTALFMENKAGASPKSIFIAKPAHMAAREFISIWKSSFLSVRNLYLYYNTIRYCFQASEKEKWASVRLHKRPLNRNFVERLCVVRTFLCGHIINRAVTLTARRADIHGAEALFNDLTRENYNVINIVVQINARKT